jgi:hypothetical protein
MNALLFLPSLLQCHPDDEHLAFNYDRVVIAAAAAGRRISTVIGMTR